MRTEYCVYLGILLASGLVGCSRPSPQAPPTASATTPATTVVQPVKRPVVRVVEQPGTVHAFEETVMIARVAGYVRALAVDPNKKDRLPHDQLLDIGSRVQKGQVLAELAVPELEEELKQKEALVRQSEAEVTQSQKALAASAAGVASAEAMVGESKAGLSRAQALYDRWESEFERVGRLVTGGVIDNQTRDETLNQFKAAEATRAEAKAKVTTSEAAVTKAEADRDKAQADVAAAEARLEVAKADKRRVAALLEYTRVKAPFDGVITHRQVNTGDHVTADGKHGLFTVAKIDPVRVVVNVPEADAGLVEEGQPIRLNLQAMGGPPSAGQVVRTSWSLQPGSRTLRTEVDLPNPEGRLRPGMYVSAKLTVELPPEWSVPFAAIGKLNDEPVMYLVEGGKAVRVVVEPYRGDTQYTQILRYRRPNSTEWTNITGEERIVTPASAVTDGQAM